MLRDLEWLDNMPGFPVLSFPSPLFKGLSSEYIPVAIKVGPSKVGVGEAGKLAGIGVSELLVGVVGYFGGDELAGVAVLVGIDSLGRGDVDKIGFNPTMADVPWVGGRHHLQGLVPSSTHTGLKELILLPSKVSELIDEKKMDLGRLVAVHISSGFEVGKLDYRTVGKSEHPVLGVIPSS